MTKKNRQRATPQQQRGPRQVSTRTNTYNALTSLPDHEDNGQLNAHLVERFTGFTEVSSSQSRPAAATPTYAEMNNDLQEYFQEKPVSGGSWLRKPEIPVASEIMGDEDATRGSGSIIDVSEELRPNKVEGPYDSNDEYLGTQYELLREDSIRPLREAVSKVRASPYLNESEYTGASIGLYEPVYITSIVFSPRGLATRVAFSLSRVKKYIRWEQSKRLITGTLVALSPADDYFRTKCVLATVAARPISALNQNPPEIDLYFANPEEIEIDLMKRWVMVEARSSFYEASRHTMLALQHMMQEPFPLSEHLVGVQKHVEPPAYLKKNPYVDMASLVALDEEDAFRNVNVLNEDEWPDNKSHGLDRSQSQALKRILTSRLAIVQGPPGTGKTYVSVVSLRVLLANMTKDDPSIIVTCQTNHALDQLLRHVAEFEPNFIRLGGRSKDKGKIKERTLYEVRGNMSQQKAEGSLKRRSMVALKKLTSTMQMILAPLEANKPPLDHRVLRDLGIITPEQAQSLEMDSLCAMGMSAESAGVQMEQWLGKSLIHRDRPLQPDDFGAEFEEEDFEVEQLQELEAEAVAQDDDDFETLPGPRTLLSGDNLIGRGGRTAEEIKMLLQKTDSQDLYTIPSRERGAVYNYFLREAKREICVQFRKHAKEYQKLVSQRKIGQWEQDLRILGGQRVIGMTTTGLSKYRGLIAALRPRIVVVEEAAETLEAPVTAACLPSLEHLILVGDHQQLRPHCQVRELEDLNFNLSLFERMVINGVELDTLTRQRRMIPEIRRLLEPIYGSTLRDHPSVAVPSNRPPVEGMGGCNSFLFTHEWLESCDGNKSALNEKEADMVVGFFDYLVLNGVDPSTITVLTFYNGQRKTITKRLRQHSNTGAIPPSSLNIVTVDSYQGEENDIVILSLVRSNLKHKIGFLSVDNRVCVALSRAKRGFYMFGNAEMLACESAVWAEVVDILYGKKSKKDPNKRRNVGYHLPLQCNKHGRRTWIKEPDDWQLINGGCEQKCGCVLPCGHNCMLRCHPFDSSLINCTQKCSKALECNHACSALCCDPCRCMICERRSNGTRALVKSSGLHTGAPKPPPAQPDPFTTSDRSGSSVDQWHAYANGGARVDDAEFVRKLQAEEAKYLETMSNAGTIMEESSVNDPVNAAAATTQATSSRNLLGLSPPKVTRSTNLIELSPPVKATPSKTANLIDLETVDNETSKLKEKDTNASVTGGGKKAKGRRAWTNFSLLD